MKISCKKIRKNIRAVLSHLKVNMIEALSRFSRLSNELAKKALSPQKHSSQLENILKLHQQKYLNLKLKQSLLSKLQSLNLPKSVIGK